MSGFSEESFVKKLGDLNPSQQSIQTLSLWLIHHRKHAKNIVITWIKELKKAKPKRKLTFLYLANDVIQNSKKKGPEFNKSFRSLLPDAYRHTARDTDEKTRGSMERLCNIWAERGVFDKEFVEKTRGEMSKGVRAQKLKQWKNANVEGKKSTENTPASTSSTPGEKTPKTPVDKKRQQEKERVKRKEEAAKKEAPAKKKKKVELSLKEEIEQEFANGPGEPPEPEILVKSLQDLENSASSDAAVRERIAALPPEVSDVSQLSKLKDKQQCEILEGVVGEACTLLNEYNARLAAELGDRKQVGKMLRDFIAQQKDIVQEATEKIQEHKDRLQQVDAVRKELKAHIQSLPDLSMLPNVTAGLAPLPSAGDLFDIDKQLGID